MSDIGAIVSDLRQLRDSLKMQLRDVEMQLSDAMKQAYSEGIHELPDGWTIRCSTKVDYSVSKLKTDYPDIYDGVLMATIMELEEKAEDQITKARLSKHIPAILMKSGLDAGQAKARSAEIIESLADGMPVTTYAVYKPADPNGGA